MHRALAAEVTCLACDQRTRLPGNLDQGSSLKCARCGHTLVAEVWLCPYCDAVYAEQTEVCEVCNAGLVRRCQQCDTLNWIGNRACAVCGGALDILETMLQRNRTSSQELLYRHQDEVAPVKERELAVAQARLDRMLEEERQQQRELQQRLREQKMSEQRTLMWVLAVSAVVVLILIVLVILGGS